MPFLPNQHHKNCQSGQKRRGMEPLYLLCSIISVSLTSLVLSFLLLLRTILTRILRLRRRRSSSSTNSASVSLYQGTVWHERRHPVRHSFEYSVRYALFDLDRSPRPPPDHLSAGQARLAAGTAGPVFLLTIPPSVGYQQNPLSLYYCYDLEGPTQRLKKCIAEVTNSPWGERVTFVFNSNSDLVAKPLHVSPFMDMAGSWRLKTNDPGDSLSVCISVQHPELGNYFVATLNAKRVSSSVASDQAIFFWLMPHKVALWIYWHAVKLWWENVQFIQHPKYTNPAYREEALIHDQKLQCCQALSQDKGGICQADGFGPQESADRKLRERCFQWRDAKWPWC